MFRTFSLFVRILVRLRGYEPQPVTPRKLIAWLRQFPAKARLPLLELLNHMQFVSKREFIESICRLNEEILARLRDDGIAMNQVIYVALDSAGSSSGVVLNLLRDHANLERRGARLVHSRDVTTLQEITQEIGRGAIIYVDDFAGSGKQFARNRRHSFDFVVGSFAEFFLLSCVCEEAQGKLDELGVVAISDIVHRKLDRPLHPESTLFSQSSKQLLVALCKEIHRKEGLGFEKLATSIALYRNTPNSTPLVLRGNLGQAPRHGILPRFDDLPIRGEPVSKEKTA